MDDHARRRVEYDVSCAPAGQQARTGVSAIRATTDPTAVGIRLLDSFKAHARIRHSIIILRKR